MSGGDARYRLACPIHPPVPARGDFCWRIPCLLLLLTILAGCGGETYRVKVLDTPGRALKGTQKPYEVNGERFDPLLTADGYAEEGTASWYGPDFHGRKTSNGEIYDMHELTAAHKTLPMNVFVKVTNLANDRHAIVRINDRGPFVKGRIIDLSYAAANALQMVGPGTAPVRIDALGYLDTTVGGGAVAYRPPASYAAGPYTVQVGAFTVVENAQRLAARLRTAYGEASIVEGWVGGKRFHRVRVGLYRTMSEAEQARATFESGEFPSSFVVAKD